MITVQPDRMPVTGCGPIFDFRVKIMDKSQKKRRAKTLGAAVSRFVDSASAICGIAAVLATAGCGRDTVVPEVHQAVASVTGAHHFDHVIIIVLENEDATTVTKVPYMDSLVHRGVFFRNYYAVAHPSYPNYLALISGNTWVGSNSRVQPDPIAYSRREFGDAQLLIDAPTVVDGLEAQHTSWNAFAEDYPVEDQTPTHCDFTSTSGLYARKHFPFLSFRGFHDHPEWCTHVRNMKWFRPDSLAGFTFVAPNLVHDGHNAPLTTAVSWLQGFLKPLIDNPAVMDSTLVIVTFDESANDTRGALLGRSRPNIIYTVFLGNMLKAGTISDVPYSHYNLLRTIESNFGLSPSLAPKNTAAIEGVWR